MTCFQDLFTESKGQPINYCGRILHLADQFPTHGTKTLRLVFESTNGDWRQGVALDVDGSFVVNGRKIPRSIVLWEDTAPSVVEFEIPRPAQRVTVWNVWDSGNGATDAWHNGAAMIVEDIGNGRRYRCNDGMADEDFDDIVFRLERVTAWGE